MRAIQAYLRWLCAPSRISKLEVARPRAMTGEHRVTDSGGLLVVGGFVTCAHGAFPVRRALTLPCE
eukprot:7764311-Lingulodinium_polyedra.AAC.1